MAKINPPGHQGFGRVTLRRNKDVYLRTWKGKPIVQTKPKAKTKTYYRRKDAWVKHFAWMNCLSTQPDAYTFDEAKRLSRIANFDSIDPDNTDKWFPRDIITRMFTGQLLIGIGETRVTTPTANVYRDAYQNLTQFVPLMLTPNNVHWDNNVFWSPTVNPSRLTVRSPGLYICGAYVYAQSPTAQEVNVALIANGTDEIASGFEGDVNPAFLRFNIFGIHYFTQDSYLQLQGYTNNTGVSMQIRNFWLCAITPEAIT